MRITEMCMRTRWLLTETMTYYTTFDLNSVTMCLENANALEHRSFKQISDEIIGSL